jgi:hypothetical protein
VSGENKFVDDALQSEHEAIEQAKILQRWFAANSLHKRSFVDGPL